MASITEAKLGYWRGMLVVAVFAAIVALAGLTSMPPLDRDEARFAQATAQMLESGDYINIKFQDSERNKKPAGIHWLQAASVSAFSSAEVREIWAYRLPSVLAVILAAVFTYLAGARLFNPATGLLGALLLSAAPGFAGEATIAKTDAMLLATVCIAQAAFIHIYARAEESLHAGWRWPILLWAALGAGILIKGPITPMILGLTGAALLFRSRRFSWISQLRPLTGAAIMVLMVAPWAILIGIETDGRFFKEAIGGDMLGKVGSVQESHSGPPGYHLAFVWILLWPAVALLAPGMIRAFTTRRAWPSYFLLAWLMPSWVVFELTATKLPHYTLPLYPALAILAARAAHEGAANRRALVRKASAAVYFLVGVGVATAVIILPKVYGDGALQTLSIAAAAAIIASAAIVTFLFWRGRSYEGGLAAAGVSTLVAFTLLEGVLPSLAQLEVSPKISAALDRSDLHYLRDGAEPTVIAGYYEPSAVFLLGTPTVMTNGSDAARYLAEHRGSAAVIELREQQAFQSSAQSRNLILRPLAEINGVNYSNGKDVSLTVYSVAP